jgi:molybdopterin converting factor small subunit
MNSLRFAAKTQRIAKGPRSVIVVDEKGTVLQRLEAELEAARQKMMDAEGKNQSLIENLSHQLEGAEKERQAELERAEALKRKCENLERLFLSSKKGDRGTNSRSTATEGKARNRADALYRRTWSAPPTFKRLVLRAHTSAVGSAAPHDYSDVAVNRAQYDPTLPAPFDQLDAMNQTAINLAQDEMTKAMLKAQREKIEKLEPLAADRGAKEIARLEAVLAEKESEHQAKLSQMEKALKEMEDKIKTLFKRRRTRCERKPSSLRNSSKWRRKPC